METFTKEEIEFYETGKTIKSHKSKNTEELIKEIYIDKINNMFGSDSELSHELLEKFKSGNDSEILSSDIKKDYLKLIQTNPKKDKEGEKNKKMNDYLQLFSQKDKLESVLKQKNNVLKYYTRRILKDAKKNRLKIINGTMIVIVIIIFSIYVYFKNHA